MNNGSDKTAAQIEREIGSDRQRIEEKLNAIQEKLTPGQLIDEALGFVKARGAGEYFANLGQTAKTNPMPLALMGVSLAWLMASPKLSSDSTTSGSMNYDDSVDQSREYPLAVVSGSVRRTRPVYTENNSHYSDFTDTAGKRFRALSDATGRRAGHFMDDTGQYFRGFADSTGQTVRDIRDETGNMLDEATGWASDTWAAAKDTMRSMGSMISDRASSMRQSTGSAMGSMRDQSSQLSDMILHQFRDQPLVAGALAFAVGAALGAALPNTRQEDELMGDAAENMRRKASDQASDLMERGEKVAKDTLEKAAAVASEVHDVAKDRIAEEGRSFAGKTGTNGDANGLGQRAH